jgi:hypothetical protein
MMFRFSPDGRTLAVAGYRWGPKSAMTRIRDEATRLLRMGARNEAEILVLDVGTGRQLAGAPHSTLPFFSPDGRTLATGEPDGSTWIRAIPRP